MAPSARFVGAFAQLLALTHVCMGYADLVSELRAREISANQVQAHYDYVVVGGGQSGLVVANRLTENPRTTVLVVEYGGFSTDPAQEDPSSAKTYNPALLFNVTAVPQPGLNGAANSVVYAAAVVGGGSTVNGMMLDRGAPEDYDNWERLGNKGWGWNDLLPYFKKATHLVPPEPKIAAEFNITYDLSAYGRNTPIELSYPTYQYPGAKIQLRGMVQAGVQLQKEGSAAAYGAYWFPGALTAKTVKRSYAANEYYKPVSGRKNLHLLTHARVNEIQFDRSKHATGVTIQPLTPGGRVQVVKAGKEIVLAAGFVHTPQILQRSGVGPASLLRKARIPIVVDLPGVGSNFQDHVAGLPSYNFTTNVSPNPASLGTDKAFTAWADALWAKNRTGPRSIGVGNVGAWIPLPTLTPDYQIIAKAIEATNVTAHLPSTYTSELIAGYKAQRALIAKSYTHKTYSAIELPFTGDSSFSLSLEHPLSRGTILLNTADKYAEPIVDYKSLADPLDAVVLARSVLFMRKWMNTPSLKQLSPVELVPGAKLTSEADLIKSLRGGSIPSTAHGIGTAALSPRNKGGVVSTDLLVYGVSGLSVVDASIFPTHIGSHTCSTVYAVAEKAADIIKARHH